LLWIQITKLITCQESVSSAVSQNTTVQYNTKYWQRRSSTLTHWFQDGNDEWSSDSIHLFRVCWSHLSMINQFSIDWEICPSEPSDDRELNKEDAISMRLRNWYAFDELTDCNLKMNVIVSISITAGLSYGAFNLSSELRKRRYEDFVLRVSPIEGRQQQSWKFLLRCCCGTGLQLCAA